MPRARKTQSGAPAQAVQSVPGQRYGEGVQSAALQQAVPLPNNQAGTAVSPSPAQPATPVPTQPTAADRYAAQVAAAKMTAGAGLLNAPTSNPTEPVTAGLPLGPGPGREAIAPIGGTPTSMFFQEVARLTGNRYFDQLGRRAAP